MEKQTKNDARSVHCKVAYKGQFRRFPLISGTEFSSLYSQVKNVLALDKEFVLKYKDNEGDLITISSNEELACAVFDGDVLRLTVDSVDEHPKADAMAVVDNSTEYPPHLGFGPPEFTGPHFPGPHFPGRHFHGHGGRGGFRGGRRWGQHHDGHSPCGGWRMKLTTKREIIQSKLVQLSEEKELSPEQQRKQACLQSKLQRIDAKLGKSEGGYEKDWRTEKHWKKHGKHGKHCGKHWKKQHRGSEKSEVFLSDEAQVEIAKLKSHIEVLLPPFKEVSSQLEAKKIALKNATVDVDTEKLLKEISDLKAVRKECKSQIKPLKKKVKELKKGY